VTTSEPPPLEPPKLAATPTAKARPSSPAAVILLYLIIVFLGAAAISPHLYASAQFLLGISHRFSFLADPPFHRFVSRCLILLAILGLPSLFRALGFQSASILGLKFNSRHCLESLHGFCWAFITLAVLAALFAGFEARTLDLKPEPARWLQHLKNAALSAAIVGILEELLFRGALFGSLRQRHSFFRAALYSSILYALLHFLARPEYAGRVHSASGFVVLAQMLRGFTDFSAMIPAFLNLTLIGVLLALVFERTGSLLCSIGLHAGFVFWLKTLNFVTLPTANASTWFWGTNKIVDGWAATLVLVVTFILVQKTIPPRPKIIVP
jgi:membrane protease YdiL (CAAX protease family)